MKTELQLENWYQALAVIRSVHEHGAFLLLKPEGRIAVYRHRLVPFTILKKARELRPLIRVLLAGMAQ